MTYFVLTNALEVESTYRIPFHKSLLKEYNNYPNLKIYNTDPLSNPSFIPSYSLKSEKLINLGMHICEKFKIDLIECQYLLPYGYVAYYLSKKFNIPFILKHAGSDLRRLLPSPSIHFFLRDIILNSKKLITNIGLVPFFREMGMKEEKIEVLNNQRAVNLSIFQPDGEKIGNFEKEGGQVLKLGLIGKPSREKGLYYFIEIIKRISELDGNVVGYITCSAYNENREQIRQIARNLKINDKIKLMNFQYPWNMPKLYRTLDIVICPEMGFGIDIHNTVIPREAMACGTLTAISEEIYRKFPYHLEESGNAFLTFNEERIHDLIREIILIRNDSDRKSTIIQNGLKFSKTIEKYKTGIQEFYLLLRELLQGG